jgi:hypothetical protein
MNAQTPITETEIASIVERFYAKVRVDPEIGPVFNDAVQNWDAHLALLKDFWSTVLLTTGRYKGNPLLAHFPLPIEERYVGFAGCDRYAQGGSYRDEHETSSRIAAMTGHLRTIAYEVSRQRLEERHRTLHSKKRSDIWRRKTLPMTARC